MVEKTEQPIYAIVPAAGVGSRMKADLPKQYLKLSGQTILECTVLKLLSHQLIDKVIVAVSQSDPYFATLSIAKHPNVIRVDGGNERADSVLSGLEYLISENDKSWALVHDAARPCVSIEDIDRLIFEVFESGRGGILAAPVRDTMKRGNGHHCIKETVERSDLWHALTPQMFPAKQLKDSLFKAMQAGVNITDEASAMEWSGYLPKLVLGRMDNLKVTQPEDLALAEYYLSKEIKEQL